MKSPRGFAAALLFLSALPLALLYQRLGGNGGDTVIHFSFALGSALLCSAVPDFRTPRWATWLGCLSMGSLAIIFTLQGISDVTRNDLLADVAFRRLGQDLEGWLVAGFLLWCVVDILVAGQGRAKVVGLAAVSLAAAVRVYASVLPLRGTSLEATAPALKLLYLMPFVWLLTESRRRPQ